MSRRLFLLATAAVASVGLAALAMAAEHGRGAGIGEYVNGLREDLRGALADARAAAAARRADITHELDEALAHREASPEAVAVPSDDQGKTL